MYKFIDENNELRKCIKIEYDLYVKKYKCSKFRDGYKLDNSNNRCDKKPEVENNEAKQECND